MQKKDTKTSKKHMNEMEWHKMDYLIFSEKRMRKRHLFCTSSHHNVSFEKQQGVWALRWESLQERVRSC